VFVVPVLVVVGRPLKASDVADGIVAAAPLAARAPAAPAGGDALQPVLDGRSKLWGVFAWSRRWTCAALEPQSGQKNKERQDLSWPLRSSVPFVTHLAAAIRQLTHWRHRIH
jgi:hypothetical protein